MEYPRQLLFSRVFWEKDGSDFPQFFSNYIVIPLFQTGQHSTNKLIRYVF